MTKWQRFWIGLSMIFIGGIAALIMEHFGFGGWATIPLCAGWFAGLFLLEKSAVDGND